MSVPGVGNISQPEVKDEDCVIWSLILLHFERVYSVLVAQGKVEAGHKRAVGSSVCLWSPAFIIMQCKWLLAQEQIPL